MTRDSQRWLVVGAAGMLGTELLRALESRNRDVSGATRADFDVTNPPEGVTAGFDVVVNCTAYTAVDLAETHEAEAFSINAVGPERLARDCRATGAHLVHISTDYVFDGRATTPIHVDAPTGPISAYGRTKLAGEWAVRAELPEAAWILRTAWLYGQHGPNFVKTIARIEGERDAIDVVNDQTGQPTWTFDLAERIISLVDQDIPSGTYHATASGQTTWFDLARKVFEALGTDPDRVRPTTTDPGARPAPRPPYSVLDHSTWGSVGMDPMPTWESGFERAWPSLGLTR